MRGNTAGRTTGAHEDSRAGGSLDGDPRGTRGVVAAGGGARGVVRSVRAVVRGVMAAGGGTRRVVATVVRG